MIGNTCGYPCLDLIFYNCVLNYLFLKYFLNYQNNTLIIVDVQLDFYYLDRFVSLGSFTCLLTCRHILRLIFVIGRIFIVILKEMILLMNFHS